MDFKKLNKILESYITEVSDELVDSAATKAFKGSVKADKEGRKDDADRFSKKYKGIAHQRGLRRIRQGKSDMLNDILHKDSKYLKNEYLSEDYDDIAIYNAPENELYELSAVIRKYPNSKYEGGKYYINFHDKKNGEGNLISTAGGYQTEKEARQSMKRLRPEYVEIGGNASVVEGFFTKGKLNCLPKNESKINEISDLSANLTNALRTERARNAAKDVDIARRNWGQSSRKGRETALNNMVNAENEFYKSIKKQQKSDELLAKRNKRKEQPKNESLYNVNGLGTINDTEYTDRVDVSFEISLGDYGIVRNPKTDEVIYGSAANDEGGYGAFDTTYISLEDVREVLEDIEDGFFDYIDSNRETELNNLDNNNLASIIYSINSYGDYFNMGVYEVDNTEEPILYLESKKVSKMESKINEARVSVDVLYDAASSCFSPLRESADGNYYMFTHNGLTLVHVSNSSQRTIISVNSANEMLKCLWAIQSYKTETSRGINKINESKINEGNYDTDNAWFAFCNYVKRYADGEGVSIEDAIYQELDDLVYTSDIINIWKDMPGNLGSRITEITELMRQDIEEGAFEDVDFISNLTESKKSRRVGRKINEKMSVKTYKVTLRSSGGKFNVTTTASSEEQAIKQVCDYQKAPKSAVISVKELKNAPKMESKINEKMSVKKAKELYKQQGFLDSEDDKEAIEVLKNANYTIKTNSRGTASVIELDRMREAFKDEMSMLTDINDLDFPQALADTVETTEDGEVLTLGKISDQIADIKTDVVNAIQDVKNDVKVELTDLKQNIQDERIDDLDREVEDIKAMEEEPLEEIEPITPKEDMEEDPIEDSEESDEENLEESLISKYLRKGKYEDLNKTKQQIDKLASQKKSADEIKDTITLMSDDDKEEDEAKKYAIDKLKESLLATSFTSKLSGLRK